MGNHVYKMVEIVGSSTTGTDDAIRNAVTTASSSLRHLDWFEVVQTRGHLFAPITSHSPVCTPARTSRPSVLERQVRRASRVDPDQRDGQSVGRWAHEVHVAAHARIVRVEHHRDAGGTRRQLLQKLEGCGVARSDGETGVGPDGGRRRLRPTPAGLHRPAALRVVAAGMFALQERSTATQPGRTWLSCHSQSRSSVDNDKGDTP